MSWKPDDEFVVVHPSAPFYGCDGHVTEVDLPFPYPIKGLVSSGDRVVPCWFRLDELGPAQADAPTEQIPVVTG